jgi:hypothetical protein
MMGPSKDDDSVSLPFAFDGEDAEFECSDLTQTPSLRLMSIWRSSIGRHGPTRSISDLGRRPFRVRACVSWCTLCNFMESTQICPRAGLPAYMKRVFDVSVLQPCIYNQLKVKLCSKIKLKAACCPSEAFGCFARTGRTGLQAFQTKART